MDNTQTSIISIVGICVSVGGAVFAAINHTRIRSVCCGRKMEVSLDVEKTTPTAAAPLAPSQS